MILEIVAPSESAARAIAARLAPRSRIVELIDVDSADRLALARWWMSVRRATQAIRPPVLNPFSPFGKPQPIDPKEQTHGRL